MSKTEKIWWISVSEIYVFFEYQFASVLVPIKKKNKKFWIDSDTIWELQGAQNSSPMPPPDPLIQVLGAQLSPRRLQEGFQG